MTNAEREQINDAEQAMHEMFAKPAPPTDIPEDVMKAAIAALHDDWDVPHLPIARAIMAERERCANLVRDWRDGHTTTEAKAWIAAAIRKGEA